MNKKCRDCQGRGRWQVQETYQDGDTCLVWYECGTCHGTAIQPQLEGDPFDIGGSSLEDDDDED